MKLVDMTLNNADIVIYDQLTQAHRSEKLNIAVLDGKIVEIAQVLTSKSNQNLDLAGLTVLPGVIDSQVHFREPGLTHKEDIESGSRAAALGGVTSFFEMPNTNPATTAIEHLNEKLAIAKVKSHCNYAFFMGAANDNVDQLSILESLPHTPGIKVFLGSSFGSLLVDSDELFEKVMRSGHRRLTIHSEDEARMQSRKHIAINEAHPRAHSIWRDEESAMISTKKSIHLAEKYKRPVHILHVSSSEEMQFLAEHKHIASVEILPQYLTLSAPECYERLGTLAQQNPPIRDKRHFDLLWQAVLNGTVDVIASDHAPHTLEEKNKPYPQSPAGFPGVQTLLPIMLNHIHNKKLSLHHFVKLVTENPCRLFSVKNKGRIAVGYDADFTVVDLKKNKTIENKWMASKCGYTPFDGLKVTGWPTHTIVNGKIVMQDDQITNAHCGQAINFNSSNK